jgi:hypothetical protein
MFDFGLFPVSGGSHIITPDKFLEDVQALSGSGTSSSSE